MKTQGEIERAIAEGMTRFEQEYMGRGPKDVHAYLIDDLVVVRLKGVLTAAEQHLVKTLPAEKGRDLLKQVRTHLLEVARPTMEAMVREIAGVGVLSLHHDISVFYVEELVIWTLEEPPALGRPRGNRAWNSTSVSPVAIHRSGSYYLGVSRTTDQKAPRSVGWPVAK